MNSTLAYDRRKGGAMQNIQEAAAAFLACKRMAVTGVSRTPKTHGSNNVYRRLRERGYQVFAVNPNTGQVEGGTGATGTWPRSPAGSRRW
jgi:predicted CoA-binding protein